PDARSGSGAGDVRGVAEAVKVRDTGGASGRVVVPGFAPAQGVQCLKIEGPRLFDVGGGDGDEVDHFSSSPPPAAVFWARSRNVRGGLPVTCSTVPSWRARCRTRFSRKNFGGALPAASNAGIQAAAPCHAARDYRCNPAIELCDLTGSRLSESNR